MGHFGVFMGVTRLFWAQMDQNFVIICKLIQVMGKQKINPLSIKIVQKNP